MKQYNKQEITVYNIHIKVLCIDRLLNQLIIQKVNIR